MTDDTKSRFSSSVHRPDEATDELVGRVATIVEFATDGENRLDEFLSGHTIRQIAVEAGVSTAAVEWALREAVQRGELRQSADRFAVGGGVSDS